MKIRIGYDLGYACPRPTPMILMLNVHHSRVADLVAPDYVLTSPALTVSGYRDLYGNWCTRLVLPAGETRLFTRTVVNDSGKPDLVVAHSEQLPVEALPDEVLPFLLASRYCETELLQPTAWELFEAAPNGWAKVQTICDFVHAHVAFGYEHARPTKTALETFRERRGVCRDFAHLAVALCRCMNIPARYCTGYLGDIGVPAVPEAMDFSAWFEAYLGGQWHTFDARHNCPRIGRILLARGRDAADVAIATSFGANTLTHFSVLCEEERE